MLGTLKMLKKLFALALVSALGLGMSAAQAQGFDHRDGNRGFHHTANHGEFRHGHNARHHRHHHHKHHGHR